MKEFDQQTHSEIVGTRAWRATLPSEGPYWTVGTSARTGSSDQRHRGHRSVGTLWRKRISTWMTSLYPTWDTDPSQCAFNLVRSWPPNAATA